MPISARARLLWPICLLVSVAIIALALLLVAAGLRLHRSSAVSRASATTAIGWPAQGQASLSVADDDVASSGPQQPVPIASLTKIMTALLVLEAAPMAVGHEGFTFQVSDADVADTERRRERSESIVPLQAGTQISERQALLALLLPSANNVAHLLAVRTAGSESAFARRMTQRSLELGMRHTRYVDASGINPRTVSTAHDQTLLARTAMQNATFAWLVRQRTVDWPASSPQRTTNRLLRRGYLGIKTGSTTPAGGCFVFAVRRQIDGQEQLIVGAVIGQRGRHLLDAAFEATVRLVDSVSTT